MFLCYLVCLLVSSPHVVRAGGKEPRGKFTIHINVMDWLYLKTLKSL